MSKQRQFVQTTRGKLVLAFALIAGVSLVTWLVNRNAFDRITQVVDNLAKPDQRLDSLQNFQKELIQLNDFYRVEVLRDRYAPSGVYYAREARISDQLKRLKKLFANDTAQVRRLNQMDSLFDKRNILFENYLRSRYHFIRNGKTDEQFENLAEQIERENWKVDSSIVTSEKQTKTYTYYNPVKETLVNPEKRGLFHRKKKVKEELKPYVVVEENKRIQVDTLAVARKKDSILENIRLSLDQVESDRKTGRYFLQKREMILIESNEILFNRVLELIRKVEQKERQAEEWKANQSLKVAHGAVSFTRILLVVLTLGTLILILFLINDVSRFRRYQRQLEASRAEAEYHSQAKQRFLANMSHEIRSPLQTIIGYTELMKKDPDYDPAKLDAVSNASEHLLHVVNEILDYSRIVAPTFQVREESVELKELVAEVTEIIAFQCKQKGLEWHFRDITTGDCRIISDAFRLKQVLLNLLGNAVKYTHSGSVSLELRTKKHAKRVAVEWIISDTGTGMSKEELERVFQQFEQGEQVSVQSGTGLGLSIVQELVQALKGDLRVQSEVNKGTTFSVRFSFELAESRREYPNELTKMEQTVHLDGMIWLVDDDPLILNLCDHLLNEKRLKHVCFDDPMKLLEKPFEPDLKLVFADVRMPGMNGMQLCRELRSKGYSNVKLIALTAQVLEEEKAQLLENGFDEVVLKPFRGEELYEVIQKTADQLNEFDFSAVRGMLEDEVLFQEVLYSFVTDSKEDFQRLREAASAQNIQELLLVVHRLAGRFAQMGSRKLALQLRELESELKQGDFSALVFNALIDQGEETLLLIRI